MDFEKAIYIIQGHHEKQQLKEAEKFLSNYEKNIDKKKFEEIAIAKYFLLSAKLQYGLSFETQIEKKLYKDMIENFRKRCEFLENFHNTKKSLMSEMQLNAFYKTIEGYFTHLEYLYEKHDFYSAMDRLHKEKMDIRFKIFKLRKKWKRWFVYYMIRETSMYGTSFLRWMYTLFITVSIFAMLFYLTDTNMAMVKDHGNNIFSYFYFSLVTVTTLGYGDISPITTTQKIIAMIETLIGYIQLGILLTLIQKKV